jgi:hypothetical protein
MLEDTKEMVRLRAAAGYLRLSAIQAVRARKRAATSSSSEDGQKKKQQQ